MSNKTLPPREPKEKPIISHLNKPTMNGSINLTGVKFNLMEHNCEIFFQLQNLLLHKKTKQTTKTPKNLLYFNAVSLEIIFFFHI